MLRLSGGKGPELARRWLAALMLAPGEEREAIVEGVEQRMAELYDPGLRAAGIDQDDAMPAHLHAETGGTVVRISAEPVQRTGYFEQVMRSYSRANGPKNPKRESSAKDGRRSRPAS